MKKLTTCAVFLFLLVSILAACTSVATPAPTQAAKGPTLKVESPSTTSPAHNWDATVQQARKEGSVALYTIWAPAIRASLMSAFKEKYGIDVEISPFADGSAQTAKIQGEQRAGLYMADVYGSGATTVINQMKPAKLLGSLEPMLILPEVKDPQKWLGSRFPFIDGDKTVIGMMFSKQCDIAYNTDLIPKGEITTYTDLLKPQYKGKMTMADPTVSGVANGLMTYLAYGLWDLDQAKNFLKQLIVQQGVVIQRDERVHVESVARGKYAIGIANRNPILEEFLRAGAPLAVVDLKEGVYASAGSGAVAVPPKGPHPNAAIVFVNWLLTNEGQTLFSKGFGSPSVRADVSTEGLLPVFVAKPGEKVFLQNEQTALKSGEMLAVAKQIIEENQR